MIQQQGTTMNSVARCGVILFVFWNIVPLSGIAADIRIDSAGLSISQEVTVSAQEADNLIGISVREGQHITTDDMVAQLDRAQAQAALVKAQLEEAMALQRSENDVNVRLARTSLKLAQIDLRRAEDSNKRYTNSVTEAELDRFRLAVERGLLEVEQAEKDLETARLGLQAAQNLVVLAETNLERRSIRAPIDGQVVEIMRRKGEWVQLGEPVVRIVQTNLLRAEAFVDTRVLIEDILERPAVLLVDVPGHGPLSFHGTVTFVSPEANPINGQVRIWAEIKNRNGLLRAGYLGTLVIKESSTEPAKPGAPSDHKVE